MTSRFPQRPSAARSGGHGATTVRVVERAEAEPGATDAVPPRTGPARRPWWDLRRALTAFPQAPLLSYYVILVSVLLLLGIGVLMVLSASTISSLRENESPYSGFLSQGKFAALGLVVMVVASRVPVGWYRRYGPAFLGATLLVQGLVFSPLGIGQGGNRNWILLPGVGTMQPSEFVKLGLCLFLARLLAEGSRHLRDLRSLAWPGLAVVALAIGLVLAGRDMGTVLVMVALVAGVYWFAGLDLAWFARAGAVGVVAVVLLVLSSASRRRRVLDFLGHGEADPTGTGFQSQHGEWALGTGGLSGVGLGASREKWVPLPEAHNDFIFAIIGEELGLIGTLLVLALFTLLAWAMLRLGQRHPDPFVGLAVGGVAVWILSQAVINVSVVVGLLPVIGIPLPLVSAGGSALVSTLLAMGVVLAFARDEPGAREALRARSIRARRARAAGGASRRAPSKGSR